MNTIHPTDEEALTALLTDHFTWMHRHPELSYEEFETTKRLRAILTAHGIRILDLPMKTGLVAEIGQGESERAQDSRVIALRADIDALPITEATGLPYASECPGKMHACGHDFHTTAVLGAALLLKEQECALPGTVRIVFQPAEEAPLTASVDRFVLTFQGRGTHAAHPEAGIDPIVCAASFIQAAQTIVSRNIEPFDAALVSITHIEAGNTWNVIPDTALVEGTARSMTAENRTLIKERLYALAEGIAAAHGATAAIDWYAGPPATNNTAHWAEVARDIAEAQHLTVIPAPPSLAGEDFAWYQETIPGCFVLVGTGPSIANHNPKFQIRTEALMPTVHFLATLVTQALSI